MTSWRTAVEKSATVALAAAVSRSEGQLPEAVASLRARMPESAITDQAHAWLSALAHPERINLLANPGFETVGSSVENPKGAGWENAGAPTGWATWTLDPENRQHLSWDEQQGRRNSRCVRFGPVDNACFIQTRPVDPDGTYVAWVWGRNSDVGERTETGLYIQWKDAQGRWTAQGQREVVSLRGSVPSWRLLPMTFTVPAGAAQAVFLCRAGGVPEGGAVFFDDASLVRVPAEEELR